MNIAIVGNGFMGKKHKSIIENISETNLVAEIDSKLKDCTNEIQFQSIDEFFDSKIHADLVVIATPNHLHYSQAKLSIENGFNVLIEKPFCFNIQQANELQEIADTMNKKIYIVMQNRFSPITKHLKQNIDNQHLGLIYNIQFNAFWNRGAQYYIQDSWKGKKSTDGGILYTQFSHLIDLLCYLFNSELKVLYKNFESFRNFEIAEIEDTALLVLETPEKTKIVVNFTTAVFEKNQETSLNIIAEKGTIKVGGQYFDQIEYQNIENRKDSIQIESSSNEENLLNLYKEIIKDFHHYENKSIQLKDGIPLVQLLDTIYNS